VFAFPNVFHFFAHKLASLSAGRFAFALILARAFDWFFFWHNKMVSPLATRLDVKKAVGGTSHRLFVQKNQSYRPPGWPLLSLTPTLFFTLALLTFTLPSLYLAVVRLAVRGKAICPVHLDFVVCP
jgi:hypothetical protein